MVEENALKGQGRVSGVACLTRLSVSLAYQVRYRIFVLLAVEVPVLSLVRERCRQLRRA